MISGIQMIFGLIIGICLLVFLITKTKVHVFLGLIICSITVGIIGGMNQQDVISSITKGFGNSLSSIGIIIGFGVMLGKLLEVSGATEVMANAFIKLFGHKKEEEALAASGFVTSLSIFCTSGFIILSPLVKGLSKKTGKSVVSLGISLAGGLLLSHTLVPPAAGPIGVAGILNVNIGKFMLFGAIISIPIICVIIPYARYLGNKIYQLPNNDEDGWIRPSEKKVISSNNINTNTNKKSLSVSKAFAPIVVPILLILLNTVLKSLSFKNNILASILSFAGSPIIALSIGLLIAIFGLTGNLSRKETLDAMEEGLKASGKLILLVGGGGALGMIIQNSGVGTYIATSISKTSIPPILLPFIISCLLRVIQGSGAVAMTTAASVTAPMISTLHIDPVFAALAACVGSMMFSYFNDSYFWVINESIGISNVKEQMKVWSITSTLACITGLIALLILNFFLG
ncbi:GntP family permease [Clostridium tyrobutyricum]|uniref:GntP family permease n=1 Tax=Clostridium tyrobutyricum TaxID=1519 RepID=UPI001C38B796|nr:GntP family permease [Clostridium tyrobutyricum]MBV4429234.1 GntP family permease [Clostridium tyrobutyricum]MBV4444427.1 GntP family permease [Clostridium tyrobutyricum]